MKYKVTLNGKTYEVEVEKGKAILLLQPHRSFHLKLLYTS